MNLALFQRSTPHVETLILFTLGVFLILWGMLAFLGWLKSKPWRHAPESSLDDHSVDEPTLSDDEQQKQDMSSMVGRRLSIFRRHILSLDGHRLASR